MTRVRPYLQAWFDSSTERALATLLDDAGEIAFWVRLSTGDLPILWQSDDRAYNPDFMAVETNGTHWLVESKMEKELESAEVKGKENAALRLGEPRLCQDKRHVALPARRRERHRRGAWIVGRASRHLGWRA